MTSRGGISLSSVLQQTFLLLILFGVNVINVESRASYNSELSLGSSSGSSMSGGSYTSTGGSKKQKSLKHSNNVGIAEASTTITTGSIMNLCSKDRDMKLVCHCSPEDYVHIKATKADCWIFHDDFPRKDPNWLAFHTQVYLDHLKLTVQRTGHLTYIPTDVIGTLKHLKSLSIEYGVISELNSYAFANLTQLRSVSLPKNQIRVLYQFAFANHPDLEEINLEQNQIIDIDRHAFVDLPNLQKLNLAHNNLTTMHDDVFSELRKLIDLRMDSNQISVLTREMFKGLGNLKSLRISNNNINFIGDTVFAELWGLSELELDNNNIEKISERAFDGLNVLRTLNLANNKLTYLERGIFTGTPALVLLDLSHNRLETVTQYNVQPLLDNLVNATSVLELTGNQLTCDCRLRWVFNLSKNTKNEDLRESLHRIQCVLEPKPTHLDYFGGSSSNLGMKKPFSHLPDNDLDDYTYEETNYGADDNTNTRIASGKLTGLLKLRSENLPCPQELIEPTELPLQRESIGFMGDLSWRSSGNRAILEVTLMFVSAVYFVVVSRF
ncbi:connectin [Culicoides brevitarsis]|uniref:connectin n=1 Tax=Culicoides brevitarsis TaxID=469753 RepID=UPI00307C9886